MNYNPSAIFRSNFRIIGIESMKWVDIEKARDSPINENVIVITRQETDNALDKNNIILKGISGNLKLYFIVCAFQIGEREDYIVGELKKDWTIVSY